MKDKIEKIRKELKQIDEAYGGLYIPDMKTDIGSVLACTLASTGVWHDIVSDLLDEIDQTNNDRIEWHPYRKDSLPRRPKGRWSIKVLLAVAESDQVMVADYCWKDAHSKGVLYVDRGYDDPNPRILAWAYLPKVPDSIKNK